MRHPEKNGPETKRLKQEIASRRVLHAFSYTEAEAIGLAKHGKARDMTEIQQRY